MSKDKDYDVRVLVTHSFYANVSVTAESDDEDTIKHLIDAMEFDDFENAHSETKEWEAEIINCKEDK